MSWPPTEIARLIQAHENAAFERTSAEEIVAARNAVWEAVLRLREWQPIETAPRDGTAILIFEPPRQSVQYEVHAVIQVAKWNVRGSWWVEAHGEGYETYEPTHWMPLPLPPLALGEIETKQVG